MRTACSVAQGLAFGARGGAGLPVLPVDSLLAVAEDARHRHGCTQVVAVLDARMDEVYVGRYAYDAGHWSASGDCSVCAPEAVADARAIALKGRPAMEVCAKRERGSPPG